MTTHTTGPVKLSIHWHNPFRDRDVIYVTPEEFKELATGANPSWMEAYPKLDLYILPKKNGRWSVGGRFGPKPDDCYTLACDQDKAEWLAGEARKVLISG